VTLHSALVRIQIGAIGLNKGNRIAFELDSEYEEQDVSALQVEKEEVQNAPVGSRAGTETHLKRSALKVGTPVFLVQNAFVV